MSATSASAGKESKDGKDAAVSESKSGIPRVRSKGNLADKGHGPTVVLKIGSSSLSTPDGKFLNLTTICHLVDTICTMRKQGMSVILVTSGAVSIGCARMRLAERPKNLITKQAIAAIGQSRLMRVYDDFFSMVEQPIAQVLLSRENLGKRHHYTNALNTFRELLRLGVIPIVNENDTVAVEELRFGDNDTLSALVASLVEADWLFLLTDVPALYTADPNKDKSAKPIHVVPNIDELKVTIGKPGEWGTGGMATKITAARIAVSAGVRTGITLASQPGNIIKMINGEEIGTRFEPTERPIKGTKKWIAHGGLPVGILTVDDGAVNALLNKKSLFAAGIKKVQAAGKNTDFEASSRVSIVSLQGKEIAQGLVNYCMEDVQKLMGKASKDYLSAVGYQGPMEVVHRDNLALVDAKPAKAKQAAAAAAAAGEEQKAEAKGGAGVAATKAS